MREFPTTTYLSIYYHGDVIRCGCYKAKDAWVDVWKARCLET